jgi:hypothetical protein
MLSKFSLRLFAVLAALHGVTPGFAQDNRGTPEQRAACMPDAFRLCASHIPDPARVESCLRQNAALLSEGCRSVFDQSGTVVATTNR